ncbi:hypothetical protein GCK72_002878 [Caenorhabditis remanei]|uniref:Uncharacterized protein n=1 Tax=Caenorhabditis remanei TaxID=31234 RepID=A0A6A5HX75_CAERE|nr:hypothetical protein GCK72_002878 [Caenorhabditis remanei]KAF1771053.1 hypothetical protein GCK72_002878 [Caenorhabditis remanei]
MLTSTSLGSIAHCYILNELRSSINKNIFSEKCFVEDNGKELIQKMLDNSNFNLNKAAIAELGERNKEEKAFPTMRLEINNKFEEGGAATRNEGDRDVEREGKFKDSEKRACK